MSSLYKVKKSPFWFIKYKDKATGVWKSKSTELRTDSANDTAKARVLKAQFDLQQVTQSESLKICDGWGFVDRFLRETSPSERTLDAYLDRWKWIGLFLAHAKVRGPGDVVFNHAFDYLDWRTGFKKRNTGKVVGRNTAIHEIKTFALIMAHAAKTGLCQRNPLVKMRIRKDDVAEKPEITDEEFAVILSALDGLDADHAWMKPCFLIAMHTGCRLKETRIAIRDLDFVNRAIAFVDPKGGKKKAFSVPMPAQLYPLFYEMRKNKQAFTLDFPFQPSRWWQHFFINLGLNHLCFHCTRVTFITRLARQGVPLSSAMRLVNHASETIHRVYQRLSIADVRIPDLYGNVGSPSISQSPGETHGS